MNSFKMMSPKYLTSKKFNVDKVALYTTVYPGCEKYLPTWYQSVLRQTDQAFDLWIGVDTLDRTQIFEVLADEPRAHWVIANENYSSTQIRRHAIDLILEPQCVTNDTSN